MRTACACRPRSATPSISTRRSPTCKRPSAGPPGETSVTRFCAFKTRPRGRLPRATVMQSSSSAGGALASPAAPLRVLVPAAVLSALAPAGCLAPPPTPLAPRTLPRCASSDAPSRAAEGAAAVRCGERSAAARAHVTSGRGRGGAGSPLFITLCRPGRAPSRCSRSRRVLWVLWVRSVRRVLWVPLVLSARSARRCASRSRPRRCASAARSPAWRCSLSTSCRSASTQDSMAWLG